jgi:hypothetical protein
MDNSRTQISEPSPSSIEKRNSSKDQTVLEISLDESIQLEDKVKNILVMIINIMINSEYDKPTVRHLWKAIELHKQQYNNI